jgi:hypothetical protein
VGLNHTKEVKEEKEDPQKIEILTENGSNRVMRTFVYFAQKMKC